MDLNVALTLLEATNGLNYINSNDTFPIVGRNAKTGELEPDKGKTEIWFHVDDIYHLTDGRYAFPKIPDDRLALSGITAEQQLEWRATFNMVVVENGEDLLPPDEIATPQGD